MACKRAICYNVGGFQSSTAPSWGSNTASELRFSFEAGRPKYSDRKIATAQMIPFLLGLGAGLAIGLVIEWLVDWRSWFGPKQSARKTSRRNSS